MQKDGCLICYDAPGRQEKINDYLEKHPKTFLTATGVSLFIEYMKKEVVNEGGKADLWDTDINFAAGLKDAPTKENIKPGTIFAGVKKKEAVQAVYLNEGAVFAGATGHPQTAGKDGAYLVKDSNGIRMVQRNEFIKAYTITNMPVQHFKQQTL